MQFTTGLLALALAAVGVTAAPNALENRQAGVVYVQFFAEAGCQGDWKEDTVYFDNGSDTCRAETLVLRYTSWKVVRNGATRPLNIYTRNDCTVDHIPEGPTGNFISIQAGEEQCYSQHIGSAKFGSV